MVRLPKGCDGRFPGSALRALDQVGVERRQFLVGQMAEVVARDLVHESELPAIGRNPGAHQLLEGV